MDARSLMALDRMRGPGMTSLSGYTPGGGMSAEDFRDAAGKVTLDDLRAIGIDGGRPSFAGTDASEAVDPERMKFDAMMALKRAQQQGFGEEHAQKQLQRAEMVEMGSSEVLRRRQNDFNEAARTPQLSDRYGEAYNYNRPDRKISALTGAAMASQARAGRPQLSLPAEQHDPIVKQRSMLSGLGRARTSY